MCGKTTAVGAMSVRDIGFVEILRLNRESFFFMVLFMKLIKNGFGILRFLKISMACYSHTLGKLKLKTKEVPSHTELVTKTFSFFLLLCKEEFTYFFKILAFMKSFGPGVYRHFYIQRCLKYINYVSFSCVRLLVVLFSQNLKKIFIV